MTALALVTSACTGDDDGGPDRPDGADDAVAALARAWSDLDGEALGGQTSDPAAAAEAFNAMTSDLSVAGADVTVADDPTCTDDGCTYGLDVTLDLAGVPDWSYTTEVTADGDVVDWSASVLHPGLDEGDELVLTRRTPQRAPIVDRSNDPITTLQEVYRVGVVPAKARPSSYARIARLTGVDADGLRERAEASEPDWFVEAITLRNDDYRPIRDALLAVPGIQIDTPTLPLTPSSAWGRALVGSVSGATEDSLANAGDDAVATDQVGSSGLQAAYEQQLAGTPGGRIQIVGAGRGSETTTVQRWRPVRGERLRTTLDRAMQDAAEQAVAGQQQTTALVAVDARTGEVLAAANGPEISSYDTAIAGNYPPGSTFKVVSAAALLEAGVGADDQVSCPATVDVDGAEFENYDGLAIGATPTLAEAIAASCNTAVIGLADRLDDADLADVAARWFGVGAEWDLPVDAFAGSVPVAEGATDEAAAMIGQGRVEMSPLGMALVAAAVHEGRAYAPSVVAGEGGGPVGEAPPDGTIEAVADMMRLTVTDGTATSLRGLAGDVGAKTGTAEYGEESPPRTHGWMIGFRGDLAFACLVVDGEGGDAAAGPVLRSFLDQAPTRWRR